MPKQFSVIASPARVNGIAIKGKLGDARSRRTVFGAEWIHVGLDCSQVLHMFEVKDMPAARNTRAV
jgi:hypothetical protein